MSRFLIFLLFCIAIPATATTLPAELHGYWVPATKSCLSRLGIRVSKNTIDFINKANTKSYIVDPCFSCAGGVRYNGNIIDALPVGDADFGIQFNVEERLGVTIVTITSSSLQLNYPLSGLELKRCK